MHGGSYWFQPVSFQYAMMNKISKMADARVVMPIYPKAPIHNVNEATAMVLARYLYLVNEELVSPEDIIFVGDSAGGGMVLSLLQMMRNRKYPLPEKAIVISPWLDVSMSNPEMDKIQGVDPILHKDDLKFEGKVYADGVNVKDPLVSPIYGDLTKLPPIHLFIGTHDIFYADAKKLNEIAFEDNVDLTMYTYPSMDHVFPAYPIPEAKVALKKIASLIK
ncbi:alpha/beta hydrolase fold domain-containing protein [Companilactobacillus insicii]|uniref:alpha/beta hydrolase fold domain-containing protein n=1 Tax=Companilactobacillus insicii TaxID=1732567 RepID=UPI002483065C|nr:alpha/beta hydrolase [Companilactobacillus insicii]